MVVVDVHAWEGSFQGHPRGSCKQLGILWFLLCIYEYEYEYESCVL